MNLNNEKHYEPQAQTRSSMARLYNMDVKTFMKCIKAIEHKFRYKEEGRRVLTIREVEYIISHLGQPPGYSN